MPSPCAQATGIAVNDECISLFNDFKLQKGDGQLRYITFKIEGDSEIVIDAKGAREKTYEDFSAEVQAADGPRYGVIDVDFTTADGRQLTLLPLSEDADDRIAFDEWAAALREGMQRVSLLPTRFTRFTRGPRELV